MTPATIAAMEQELPSGAIKLFESKTSNAIILNRIPLNSLHVAPHDDLADATEVISSISCGHRSVWA